MSTRERRIGIIGGGPAGLTAAHRLQRGGARVVLLEAREQVGGRARTDRIDGFQVDGGAQLLGSMYTRALGLAQEAGLRDQLVRSPGRDALWRDGRAHEVVYGSVTSMLASGGLPLRTKMRLGTSYVPFLTRHAAALDLHSPERVAYGGLDTESIAAWGEREIGPEFVEYLVYPQLAAYHGCTPEETSAGLYHLLARHGMDVSVYALRGGIGSLCEALAARLREGGGEVRLSTPVERAAVEGDQVRVAGPWGEERFDGVVVATPAPAAARLLADPPPALAAWLAGVRTAPAITLALLLDRPLGVRWFGLSFPREASGVLSAVCAEENKAPGLVPAGKGLLVAFATRSAAARLARLEPRAVLDALLPEVERFLPGVGARVQRARVFRWPDGNPVFYPGWLGRIGAFHGERVEGDAPLALAGDYLSFPSVEGAVSAGAAAADRLSARLATRI